MPVSVRRLYRFSFLGLLSHYHIHVRICKLRNAEKTTPSLCLCVENIGCKCDVFLGAHVGSRRRKVESSQAYSAASTNADGSQVSLVSFIIVIIIIIIIIIIVIIVIIVTIYLTAKLPLIAML